MPKAPEPPVAESFDKVVILIDRLSDWPQVSNWTVAPETELCEWLNRETIRRFVSQVGELETAHCKGVSDGVDRFLFGILLSIEFYSCHCAPQFGLTDCAWFSEPCHVNCPVIARA